MWFIDWLIDWLIDEFISEDSILRDMFWQYMQPATVKECVTRAQPKLHGSVLQPLNLL